MKSFKNILVNKIEFYLINQDIEKFWKDFHLFYADVPEKTKSLTEYDWNFFDELNEKLHHTDWQILSDPKLIPSKEFITWVKHNFPKYLSGDWK